MQYRTLSLSEECLTYPTFGGHFYQCLGSFPEPPQRVQVYHTSNTYQPFLPLQVSHGGSGKSVFFICICVFEELPVEVEDFEYELDGV